MTGSPRRPPYNIVRDNSKFDYSRIIKIRLFANDRNSITHDYSKFDYSRIIEMRLFADQDKNRVVVETLACRLIAEIIPGTTSINGTSSPRSERRLQRTNGREEEHI